MRLLNEGVLDTLIRDAQHKPLTIVNSDVKPSFKPDPQLGEGRASRAEHDYRSELLLLIGAIYPVISKIIHNQELTTAQKVSRVEDEIASFTARSKNLIDESLPVYWREAVQEANANLRRVESNLQQIQVRETRLDIIKAQQESNTEDIGNYLQGRLTSGLRLDEVGSFYQNHTTDTSYLNSGFNEAVRRTDQMGSYGYLQTYSQGVMTTYTAGALALKEVLVADWVTVGDSNVCGDCEDLEAGSPYHVDAWPEEPHLGCRCGADNVRIEL